jgi:hypothetical protein
MKWTKLQFGKHAKRTLPHVVLHDPDWFFWAMDTKVFLEDTEAGREAAHIYRKAINIKLPCIGGVQQHVDHYVDRSGKYSHFVLVPSGAMPHSGSSSTVRQAKLDLSIARRHAPRDKLGGKNLIACFRAYYLGAASVRITADRAEGFFENGENFIVAED